MDTVLVAADKNNLDTYLNRVTEKDLGLELQAFANPEVLAGNWLEVLADHKRKLAAFSGRLGIHGAFYDMVSASLDPAVVDVTRIRYRQNLQAAVELGAEYVVFHLNYMGILKLPHYRSGWHRRQVAFWKGFIQEASTHEIYILLENLWEDDPTLMTDILEEVNNPYLKTCLDIAHATLFSKIPAEKWINTLSPHLHLCHLNNHDGELDQHWELGKGTIDYQPILEMLRELPQPPMLTLEMPNWQRIEASLPLLH
jgi:sugar phosphate isomerase/epimerase